MKINSRALYVFAIATVVMAGATQTFAQATGSQQPSDVSSGGGNSNPKARQKLDVTVTSTGGYDSDAGSDVLTALGVGGAQVAGYSSTLVSAADYALQGRRMQLRATETSSLRYSRPPSSISQSYFGSVSHSGAVGFFVRSRKNSLAVNQTGLYSSSPLYSLFPGFEAVTPGDAPAAAPDYAVNTSKSDSYGTAMTLTRQVARRSSVSAIADWQHTDTFGVDRRGLNMYGLRGQVSQHLSRSTSATAGYFYRLGAMYESTLVTTTRQLTEKGADVGMDYRRGLSASRQVTLSFRLGASALAAPGSIEGADSGGRYDEVSAQMAFGYQFARRWRARAAYDRGIDYVAGLSEPVSANSFSTSINGPLTRRLSVLVSAAYSSGESALNRRSSVFDTYTGDVRLSYAVTRAFSTYVEDLYYFYDSRGSAPLVPGIPSNLERKGIRVGVALRVPTL